MATGEVVIDTRVKTTKAEKDLEKLENELIKFNDKGEKLLKQKAELEINKKNVEDANRELQKYNDYLEKAKTKLATMKSSGANLYDYSSISKTEDLVKMLESDVLNYKQQLKLANIEYEKAKPKINDINKKLKENAKSQQDIKNKIEEANEKLKQTNLKQIQQALQNTKKSASEVITKVTKWALALFGVRTAYSFISRAMSTLSQSNEQIATDIEYIRWALATTLQPVIEFIIKLVYQLLGLINSISIAIFGVNLFANASADAFKKTKDNLKGSNKQAKELKKTLTGFDEMNIIQDNGSTATGGGGGGVSITPPDLSQIDTTFLDPILNWWDYIIQFWEEDITNFFDSIGGTFGTFFSGLGVTLKGFWEVAQSIGEFIIGLVDTIWGVLTLNFDKIKEGFGIMIDAVFNGIKGSAELVVGIITSTIGFIGGVLTTFTKFIYNNVIKPVADFFAGTWDNIKIGAKYAFDGIKSVFSGLASFFGSIFSKAWTLVKNVFSTGGAIFVGIVDGIVNAFVRIVNAIIGGLNKVVAFPFQKINDILNWIRDIDIPLIGQPFKGFWSRNPIPVPQIPTIPYRKGGIVNMPGKGVPIAGETAQEGVIPLTDSQQMELLGKAIAENINLTANIPVYVSNRVVAREIRKILAESDFAFNR